MNSSTRPFQRLGYVQCSVSARILPVRWRREKHLLENLRPVRRFAAPYAFSVCVHEEVELEG